MFATALRGHRRRSGLTQEELAERAGIGVRTIRDLESGRDGTSNESRSHVPGGDYDGWGAQGG